MALLDRHGVPIRYCSIPGCSKRATRYLQIGVPPHEHPMSRGVRATLGLILCQRHAEAEKVETFLTDEMRNMLSGMVAKSPIPLDFDRARLFVRVLGDKNWQALAPVAAEGRSRRFG